MKDKISPEKPYRQIYCLGELTHKITIVKKQGEFFKF